MSDDARLARWSRRCPADVRAFGRLRQIQLMRVLAPDHPSWSARLDPAEGWSLETLLTLDLVALERELAELLAAPAAV